MEYYKNLDLKDIAYIDDDGLRKVEIWKDVVGFENRFMVSNLGRVKTLNFSRTKTHKILKSQIDRYGYVKIALHNIVVSYYTIHRLVALAFIPNPENKREVNHKKGIKTDNRVSELEWLTTSENQLHSYSTKLRVSAKGEKVNGVKLTESNVLEIRKLKNKYSQKKIGELYNVTHTVIGDIFRGTSWKHI